MLLTKDQIVHGLTLQLVETTAERDQARTQLGNLAAQVGQLQADLTALQEAAAVKPVRRKRA